MDPRMGQDRMAMDMQANLQLVQKLVLRLPVVPLCVVTSLSLVPAFATQIAQGRVIAAPTMRTFVECSATSTLDTMHHLPLPTVPLPTATSTLDTIMHLRTVHLRCPTVPNLTQ